MTLLRTTCQQDEHGLKIPQYLYVFHPLLNLIRSSHKRAENSGQVHLQRKVFRAVVSLDGHFLTRDGFRGSRPVMARPAELGELLPGFSGSGLLGTATGDTRRPLSHIHRATSLVCMY